jgi:hypothetical protein
MKIENSVRGSAKEEQKSHKREPEKGGRTFKVDEKIPMEA